MELFLFVMDELSIRIETKCVLESSDTSVCTLKSETVVPQGLQNFCLLQHNIVTWKGECNVLKPHSEFFRNY